MGSFVTLDLQSLSSLLEACHNCTTGKPSQVNIGDTLAVQTRNEVVRPFTFICCGVVVNTQGAIFWHSKDITTDVLTNTTHVGEQPLEVMQIKSDQKTTNEFEDVFVKCEDESSRKLCDEDSIVKSLIEEDPLLVDGPSSVKEKSVEQTQSVENVMQSECGYSSGNRTLRKQIIGLLSHQDSLAVNDCLQNENEFSRKMKYPDTFTCEFCGKLFKGKERAYQFYYHRNREHTHEIVYKCEICPKTFWGDRELLAHVAEHKDPGHICHICGQKFNSKRNLKAHLLVHNPVREYMCRYCDKMFRRKDHLRVHERTHTGVRPYQCQWCESGYPQKHQLHLHMRKCPILKRQEANQANIFSKNIASGSSTCVWFLQSNNVCADQTLKDDEG